MSPPTSRFSEWERETTPPRRGCSAMLLVIAVMVLACLAAAAYAVYITAVEP